MTLEGREATPGQVEQYRAGKVAVAGFFVGQVMKQSQGRYDPAHTKDLIIEMLGPVAEA